LALEHRVAYTAWYSP